MTLPISTKAQRVFHYFEEICKIPHASYNTKPITDYLEAFAKEHRLEYRRDEYDNIIIMKAATKGYEEAPVVIWQGHSDMVAEKDTTSKHDFATDGIKLLVEGDYLTADKTTLGGDDGIAVAYMLAMLEAETIPHPAFEMVITANEEVGLLGATQLNTSGLKGRRLINLDSEEEGVLLAGCAGGLTAHCLLPAKYERCTDTCFEIVISGLKGGHSGMEIDKNRANANVLMGRLLHTLNGEIDYELAKIKGGEKENVITSEAKVLILTSGDNSKTIETVIEALQRDLRHEYAGSDDGIAIKTFNLGKNEKEVLPRNVKEKLIFFLMNVPYGVQKMSENIQGLVETSANIGSVKLNEEGVVIKCSARSMNKSAKAALAERIKYLTEFLGGEFNVNGEYPAWEYQEVSPLRTILTDVYKETFGKEMKVTAIHAGLECGIFYDKMNGLDCVSLGPDVYDVHSTNEKISISSVERVWEYLLSVVKALK